MPSRGSQLSTLNFPRQPVRLGVDVGQNRQLMDAEPARPRPGQRLRANCVRAPRDATEKRGAGLLEGEQVVAAIDARPEHCVLRFQRLPRCGKGCRVQPDAVAANDRDFLKTARKRLRKRALQPCPEIARRLRDELRQPAIQFAPEPLLDLRSLFGRVENDDQLIFAGQSRQHRRHQAPVDVRGPLHPHRRGQPRLHLSRLGVFHKKQNRAAHAPTVKIRTAGRNAAGRAPLAAAMKFACLSIRRRAFPY